MPLLSRIQEGIQQQRNTDLLFIPTLQRALLSPLRARPSRTWASYKESTVLSRSSLLYSSRTGDSVGKPAYVN